MSRPSRDIMPILLKLAVAFDLGNALNDQISGIPFFEWIIFMFSIQISRRNKINMA